MLARRQQFDEIAFADSKVRSSFLTENFPKHDFSFLLKSEFHTPPSQRANAGIGSGSRTPA